MSSVVEVSHLSKTYHATVAVDQVSFSINPGEVVGLLGPNGAGKTTTINMILGILAPSSGSITILGHDATNDRAAIAGKMNFSAVYAQLPGNLTVYQNLFVFGLLYRVPNVKQRVAELIDEFELDSFRKTKAGLLSSGEASRLSLAKAFINTPALLLLDEPTASLDPSVAQDIRFKIKTLVERHRSAVLWTSHNMREIEAVCDRVLFLSHGKILLAGDPKTLAAEYGKRDLDELFISVAREPLTLREADHA